MTALWWEWLFSAFAMVLVLEGLMPFAFPEQWRNMLRKLIDSNNTTVRWCGLTSMLVGVLILVVIHHVL